MKGKELLLIAISSFALTVIWIASNVYHSYATSTIDTLLKIQILPIYPSFDMAMIDKLKKRQVIQSVMTSFTPVTPSPDLSPTPAQETVEEIPTPTPEPIILPSDTPTPTGELVILTVTPTPIESGPTP